MFNPFKKTDEEQFPCPRDQTPMRKKVINDVIIDICPKCRGVWLDDNEIDKLITYSKQLKIEPKKK